MWAQVQPTSAKVNHFFDCQKHVNYTFLEAPRVSAIQIRVRLINCCATVQSQLQFDIHHRGEEPFAWKRALLWAHKLSFAEEDSREKEWSFCAITLHSDLVNQWCLENMTSVSLASLSSVRRTLTDPLVTMRMWCCLRLLNTWSPCQNFANRNEGDNEYMNENSIRFSFR